jgi:hypothetical protein
MKFHDEKNKFLKNKSTLFQIFFKFFAVLWCYSYITKSLMSILSRDSHTPVTVTSA